MTSSGTGCNAEAPVVRIYADPSRHTKLRETYKEVEIEGDFIGYPVQCQDRCQDEDDCKFWTFVGGRQVIFFLTFNHAPDDWAFSLCFGRLGSSVG